MSGFVIDLAALGLGLVVVPLYVDDNAENVRAARALGMETVRFGDDRYFPAALRAAHLQTVLKLANLLDENSSRFRFRLGHKNLPRL